MAPWVLQIKEVLYVFIKTQSVGRAPEKWFLQTSMTLTWLYKPNHQVQMWTVSIKSYSWCWVLPWLSCYSKNMISEKCIFHVCWHPHVSETQPADWGLNFYRIGIKPWKDMSPKIVTGQDCAVICMTVLCSYHLRSMLKCGAFHAVETSIFF